VADDDTHVFQRGKPLEICSKTLAVLSADAYSSHFAMINRSTQSVTGASVSCDPGGSCC